MPNHGETCYDLFIPVVVGEEAPANTPWILRRFLVQYIRSEDADSVDRSADVIARSLEESPRVGAL